MSIEAKEEFRPKIVAFCCNWCSYAGADLAGSSRLSYPADVKIIGVENGRTRVEWVSAAEGVKFSQTMNEFVEKIHSLGKNVRLEDLRCRN